MPPTAAAAAAAAPVRVAVRVRPLSAREAAAGAAQCVGAAGNSVTLVDPVSLELSAQLAHGGAAHGGAGGGGGGGGAGAGGVAALASNVPRRVFHFDHVFHRAHSQAEIFAQVGAVVVDHAWSGYNASVFAYGQTGTGKSFTMLGGAGGVLDPSAAAASETTGLIPRLCRALFERAARAEAEQAAAVTSWAARRQARILRGEGEAAGAAAAAAAATPMAARGGGGGGGGGGGAGRERPRRQEPVPPPDGVPAARRAARRAPAGPAASR